MCEAKVYVRDGNGEERQVMEDAMKAVSGSKPGFLRDPFLGTIGHPGQGQDRTIGAGDHLGTK